MEFLPFNSHQGALQSEEEFISTSVFIRRNFVNNQEIVTSTQELLQQESRHAVRNGFMAVREILDC
jgi:hypothetical protein